MAALFPAPWQLIHRVDLHNALKDLAVSTTTKGTPVVISLKSRVISVDIDAPSLTLEDGTTHVADLIIGADGVHSALRKFVIKDATKPVPSGTSAFRFLIPSTVAAADPVTKHFTERKGEMRLLYGEDRRLVIYPCRDNTLLNFVALHPEEETEAASDSWDQTASLESVLECFKSYPEDVKALLAKTDPQTINLWKLLDHHEFGKGKWTAGNVALLGDAAHPFLPHQGQGGAQAIEDACALGALLPLGTRVADIEHRLELYTEARYDRATMVQDFTRDAAFKTSRGKHGGKVLDPMQFTNINFTHDAYDHASAILKRDLVKNALFKRMPLGFGPSPGPRQGFDGRTRKPSSASYKTSWMKFKTPKSFLQTLLPSDDFAIDTVGGWATASFTSTKLENLEWLGGRGYTFFGLHIHDVVYANCSEISEKTQLRGDFMPVLFENLADPIITGREELGFSKVYATLAENSTDSKFELSAGWEGTEFCKLEISGLDASQTSATDEVPTLHYKVIASSQHGGAVDAEYATAAQLPLTSKDEKRWKGKEAGVQFTELEGEELERAFPTLAHIVRGLRDIKVAEVLDCGVKSS